MKERQQKLPKNISLKILLGILSFALSVYIFGAISHQIFHHESHHLDEIIFEALTSYMSDRLVWWMRVFSFFGKPHFLIPAYILLVVFFLVRKDKRTALEVGVVAATSTIFSFGLKFIFQRDRPSVQVLDYLGGYSYPSGHAFLGFVFCSVITYLALRSPMPKKYKYFIAVLMFVFALAIGISRIVLRVHYASDVIAGFALGYAWVLLFFWIQRKRI